ncbi:DUF4235 domain-containing protein, partial [Streptomyces sp. NPDC059837]|uniref:DUF4235 domain-containing protein n=1 Tax=Streptomyces sp. NPDC059837 TaxID=3346968 RepID=UPI00364D34E1
MSKKASKKPKKLKLPLAYKPLGFALSWASGTLAGIAFRATWKAIPPQEDAPDPQDQSLIHKRSCRRPSNCNNRGSRA